MLYKIFKLLLVVFLVSCNLVQSDKTSLQTNEPKIKKSTYAASISNNKKAKIEFIECDNTLYGDLTYTTMQKKLPIKLIGQIEDDSLYRITGFTDSGLVEFIIVFNHKVEPYKGTFFVPKELMEYELRLKNISNNSNNELELNSNNADKSGSYYYSYGENTYTGEITIQKLFYNWYSFSLIAVGNGSAPPIVNIETDTVEIKNNELNYKIKNTDSCSVLLKFYKDFIHVKNLETVDCYLEYGFNTYPDGFYIKLNKTR